MTDLREELADAIEAAMDNVHDMDVPWRAYAEAAADAALPMIEANHNALWEAAWQFAQTPDDSAALVALRTELNKGKVK